MPHAMFLLRAEATGLPSPPNNTIGLSPCPQQANTTGEPPGLRITGSLPESRAEPATSTDPTQHRCSSLDPSHHQFPLLPMIQIRHRKNGYRPKTLSAWMPPIASPVGLRPQAAQPVGTSEAPQMPARATTWSRRGSSVEQCLAEGGPRTSCTSSLWGTSRPRRRWPLKPGAKVLANLLHRRCGCSCRRSVNAWLPCNLSRTEPRVKLNDNVTRMLSPLDCVAAGPRVWTCVQVRLGSAYNLLDKMLT
jgi:hypothetical protein